MVISGRPRAHSASSIKFTSVSAPSRLKKGASYSSPELRSMLVELETTVPLSIIPSALGSSRGFKPGQRMAGGSRCCDCQCCRLHILLVTLQVLLGVTITAMSLYVQLFIPAARLRETPYWAGVPVSLFVCLFVCLFVY